MIEYPKEIKNREHLWSLIQLFKIASDYRETKILLTICYTVIVIVILFFSLPIQSIYPVLNSYILPEPGLYKLFPLDFYYIINSKEILLSILAFYSSIIFIFIYFMRALRRGADVITYILKRILIIIQDDINEGKSAAEALGYENINNQKDQEKMHSDMIIYAKKMSPDNDSKDKNPYNEIWMMTPFLRDFMYFDNFSRYINVNIFDRSSPRHLFQHFLHPCFSSLPDLDFKLKDNWESIFDSKAKTFKLSIYKNFIYYLIGVHLLLGIFFIYYNFGYGWILI